MVSSKKILIISIIFIILLSGFCFGSTPLTPVRVEGLAPNSDATSFVSNYYYDSYYYYLRLGHTYRFYTDDTGSLRIISSKDVPDVGVSCSFYSTVGPNSEFTYTVTDDTYFYFTTYTHEQPYFLFCEDITPNVMNSTVTQLAFYVSNTNLWGVFKLAIPYILIVVIVVFGFYLIRRMIKGLSKGKSKV